MSEYASIVGWSIAYMAFVLLFVWIVWWSYE